MSMQWFRMYSEFSHDPKVQMMTEAMQRRFIMLLCLQCSNGLVTLHEEEIAFHLRISDADLGETKALFISKGFINESWELSNWSKRQFTSDSSKPRVAKHRALQKEKRDMACNVTETLPQQNCNVLEQNRTEQNRTEGECARPPSPTGSPPPFFPEYREFIKTERPDLDADVVFSNFLDHYPPAKCTAANWRKWVRREHPGSTHAAGPPKADPDSRLSIETMGLSLGFGQWDQLVERWESYKSRVKKGVPA